MFCLTHREYRRWLQLEADERRSASAEAELRGYLAAIAAAERQVRRLVAAYLRARQCRQPEASGVGQDEIYRALAPRLPDVWGLRITARVRGWNRGDESGRKRRAFVGKMLILDEALLALCASGRVEAGDHSSGKAAFRWRATREASGERQRAEGARAGEHPARKSGTVGARPQAADASPAATCRTDLRALLASLGAFVGFDE